MSARIEVGLRRSQTLNVDESLTVPHVAAAFTGFADMPPVFATAFLVGFVEWVCVEALRPCLGADEQSVGVHVNMSHSAATPIGMSVTAQVELVEINGSRLRFKVMCRDEIEVVSEGHHERFIIKRSWFDQRMSGKHCRSSVSEADHATLSPAAQASHTGWPRLRAAPAICSASVLSSGGTRD